VHIDDPDAPFTIVVEEDTWTGQITQQTDGSYRLQLSAP
jgi:hypothetical protein